LIAQPSDVGPGTGRFHQRQDGNAGNAKDDQSDYQKNGRHHDIPLRVRPDETLLARVLAFRSTAPFVTNRRAGNGGRWRFKKRISRAGQRGLAKEQ
jgi:hypothetical protein